MHAGLQTSQARLLIGISVLMLAILACGASSSGSTSKASAASTPTGRAKQPQGATQASPADTASAPRTVPTLVPTYTRMPTLTATSTGTPTSTRTPTRTVTQTPTRTFTFTRVPTPLVVNTPMAATGMGTGALIPPQPAWPTSPPPEVCRAPQTRTDLAGKIIFWSDRAGGNNDKIDLLYVMNPDGSNQKLLTSDQMCARTTYDYFTKRQTVSNDGQWHLHVERAGSGTSIFLRDSRGQLVRRVTTLDGNNYFPEWSPDQAHLAFTSSVDQNDEIYVSSIDGTYVRRLTFNTWEWDKHPSWSVDGKSIVFYSNRSTMRMQIWKMQSDGYGQANISNNAYNDWDPIWVR